MNLNEEVEQFKLECKSYNYLRKKEKELLNHLEEVENALIGVKSPVGERLGSNHSDKRLVLYEKKSKLIFELTAVRERMNNVTKTLEQICDKDYKKLVVDLFVHKIDYRVIATEFNYEPTYVYKKAEQIIKYALIKQN